jgi:hypothetical protein
MFARPFFIAFSFIFAVPASLLATPASVSSSNSLSPREVLQRFDSLLSVGGVGQAAADSQAKALCAGTARRTFSFLAEAEHRLTPFVDSAQSRDTVVEEKCRDRWCGLKDVSDAVFRKPLMGMQHMHSVEAVYLFRRPGGWKVAEFEELADEKAPLVLPEDTREDPQQDSQDTAFHPLFPVSKRAPQRKEEASGGKSSVTRMRLRISLSDGDSLPDLPQGAGQRVLQRGRSWAWVETSQPEIPPFSQSSDTAGKDSLKAYLGSGSYLDLKDSLLLAKATQLSRGAGDQEEIVRRVYGFLLSSFQFRLGASLFSDSHDALRSLEGDCSEAAVLTTALLRAAGVPSRVDLGFATLGHGVFIGHAWSEAFVNGRWIGVDAALREFPAGAERLLLLRLSGSGDMRIAASNLMLQSLSNLDIEITDAWAGSRPLVLEEQHGNAKEGEEFFEEVLQGIGEPGK